MLHETTEGGDVVVGLGLVTEVKANLGEVLDLLKDSFPFILMVANKSEIPIKREERER